MSTMSASPAESPARASGHERTLVWDAPVRVFHWLMVASFAGAWLTAESERWRLVHVTLGYTVAALVAFRIVWGFVGTRHARFAAFVRGPSAVARYLGALLRGAPERHAGHNPAGALAIVALLVLAALVTGSGWATDAGIAGDALGEVHEALASTMLALVAVHVAAVIVTSVLHRENLVAAMIHGRKRGAAGAGIRRPWRSVAAALVAGVLGLWWTQWSGAPSQGDVVAGLPAVASARHEHRHHDD